jgi:hypothetical protein
VTVADPFGIDRNPERTEFEPLPGEVLPQPHEGITGVDRTGSYLLSLDDEAIAHRDALIAMADLLRSACMVGSPAPIVEHMSRRLSSPQVGDLVVEDSARMRTADTERRIKGFGYLVARRREWGSTDEQWDEYKRAEAEGPYPHEVGEHERMVEPDAWYIQYGPNPADVCRWENCGFTVLPIGEDFHASAGTRNPDGSVTLVRDDILGALADSGITLRGLEGDRG